MTDDITWDDMTQPETMKGKAAGKKFFADDDQGVPRPQGDHAEHVGRR